MVFDRQLFYGARVPALCDAERRDRAAVGRVFQHLFEYCSPLFVQFRHVDLYQFDADGSL